MDQQKLRTLVFEKTGVRIDIDDPVFAVVALNEAVLAEAVERHVALLDAATRELAVQAQGLRESGAICRCTQGVARPAAPDRRSIALALGAAVLGALLVLLGQVLLK